MRYFIEDFEAKYNSENPFGFFPDWEHYQKTGTHIGTDFKVVIGTQIFAPTDGEMFKAEFNQYKGNVGIYIFQHEGVTWGLELCHLKELPQTGTYKEGDKIALSGNTGGATTGAHLHAVLHRDAKVTKNYQELQSRDAFLKLEKEVAIVDCFTWFCEKMKQELKSESKPQIQLTVAPKNLEINVSDTIITHDSFELKTFTEKIKEFLTHVIGGWFPSKRTDLSPDGVQKERVIDRINDKYSEKVVDVKTGRVIRDVEEKPTDHK